MPAAVPIGDGGGASSLAHGGGEVECGVAVRGIGAGLNGDFAAQGDRCLVAHDFARRGEDARGLRGECRREEGAERGENQLGGTHGRNVRCTGGGNKHGGEGGRPFAAYAVRVGSVHFKRGKREKSVSAEQSSAPFSMARAARCASGTSGPALGSAAKSSRRMVQ